MHILLDTGPLVALLSKDDRFHEWEKAQFALHPAPFITCEAVVAETCFLLYRSGFDPARALMLIERGVVRLVFSLGKQLLSVRALFERYDNVPASLADACLVRMAELHEPSLVMTLDSDFKIYRCHGRKAIATLSPDLF
jgi:uncharacterized protein